jgi:thiamine-monophosphate kinase
MLDISDGLAVDAGHLARGCGCRLVIDLARVPLAPGASIDDLSFGEDYELLAATADPLEFTVIGNVVEGTGLEIHRDGNPVALSGWDHFGAHRVGDLR